MKKERNLQRRRKAILRITLLAAVLLIGFWVDRFSIVSYAESAAKVTASTAKIRKEPNTTSETLGSVKQNDEISIRGQLSGSDGHTWYQIYKDANTLGYVRSDLVQITDGSTPPTVTVDAGAATPNETTPLGPDEPLVGVTAVNPVSATVTGSQPVRVRQNASTTSRIVTTAQNGLVLTVIATAAGTDGKDWYQVNFIANSAEVTGFIRSDYVQVSGELVPAGTEAPEPEQPPADAEPEQPEPVAEKDWDTYYEGGSWHLIDNGTGNSYNIENIFKVASDNKKAAEDALASKKKLQIVIVMMLILLIAMAALASYLIFRLKDMTDSAYFNEVERETVRRRTADRPQGNSQKVMHTVGTDKRAGGQRPAPGQGQRPASGQGQRPAPGQGQRPAPGQGQRPAPGQGQRPAPGQGQRPAPGQGQRPAAGQSGQQREQGRRPKNFVAYDDEFDQNFINDWDSTDEDNR